MISYNIYIISNIVSRFYPIKILINVILKNENDIIVSCFLNKSLMGCILFDIIYNPFKKKNCPKLTKHVWYPFIHWNVPTVLQTHTPWLRNGPWTLDHDKIGWWRNHPMTTGVATWHVRGWWVWSWLHVMGEARTPSSVSVVPGTRPN